MKFLVFQKLSHYYGMFSHQKRIKKNLGKYLKKKEIIYWIANDNLRIGRIGQAAFLRSLVCTVQFVRFFKSAEISIGPRRLWYLLPLLSSDEKYTYFDIIFFFELTWEFLAQAKKLNKTSIKNFVIVFKWVIGQWTHTFLIWILGIVSSSQIENQ